MTLESSYVASLIRTCCSGPQHEDLMNIKCTTTHQGKFIVFPSTALIHRPMSFPAATQAEAFDDTSYRIANGNTMHPPGNFTPAGLGSAHILGSGYHSSSVDFLFGSDRFNPDVLLYRLTLLRTNSCLKAVCGLTGREATTRLW